MIPPASYCRVDAGGVPAEWVEITPATEGQPTLVLFLDLPCDPDPLETGRLRAGRLAATTRARVITVACRGTVERAVAAYAWLLREGCDPETTSFVCDSDDASLLPAILGTVRAAALPPPKHASPTVSSAGVFPAAAAETAYHCRPWTSAHL